MLPALIVKQVVKLAVRGLISEKVIKALVIKLVETLVKSTKSKVDDKAWEQIKKILEQKKG
jgi:predicted HAD superfamily phosphohydrolase YqeG